MPSLTPHENQIRALFALLQKRAAAGTLPQPGAFGAELGEIVHEAEKRSQSQIRLNADQAACFVTAAVEIWHRAIHSFVISTLLSNASPVWASVCGYYASHYSVRGVGHLLGFFQLHRKRRIVELLPDGTTFAARIVRKDANTREHKFYWKIVKQHPIFASDPFFVFNNDQDPVSDGAHRNFANYLDHVDQFPNVVLLQWDQLQNRVQHVAAVELSAVPIPDARRFPDLDSVQLIAYHRIVRFRSFLDELLGDSSRFWRVHRNPSWSRNLLDFQVVTPKLLQALEPQS